jgi:hypothetical protein
MRIDWAALPEAVTKEVIGRAGGSHIVPATTGDHAEIAATVTGTNGAVFVKAAHTDFGVRSLRFELRPGEAVGGSHSPTVEWHFETEGWLVVGFEHCEGRYADLSPASPDLDLLGDALTVLGETPVPDVPLFSPTARLGFEHPAMDGDTLVHTDLGPANLIVTPRGLSMVRLGYGDQGRAVGRTGHAHAVADQRRPHSGTGRAMAGMAPRVEPDRSGGLGLLRDEERAEVGVEVRGIDRGLDA